MLRDSAQALRWLVSLGAKFARVAPGPTAVAVVATLISQVSVLLAFFLPLKVLILLGSDGMPRYFPPVFEQFDRDRLVIWLSIATIVFYVLHLSAERVMSASASRGTRLLLQRSHKLVLFENQSDIAAKGYQRYSQALAGGFFSILAITAIFFVYLELALLLVAISLLVALLWAGAQLNEGTQKALAGRLGQFLNVAGAVGFLVIFAYLVVDFLFGSPPTLLWAIVSMLLARQFLSRSTAAIMAIVGLRQQRAKMDALFFHGKALLPEVDSVEKGIWPLLQPERRRQWVGEVLAELGQTGSEPPECEWMQAVAPNTAMLRVRHESGLWLVKLYDTRRQSLAQHEANLLGEKHHALVAPEYLGGARVVDSHCHVLAVPPGELVADSEYKAAAMQIRADLLKVEPDEDLVQRYLRSHPLLWQRLDSRVFERLEMAAGPKDRGRLETLLDGLDRLRDELRQLPLGILNPKMSSDAVFQTSEGDMMLLDWGHWRLEPVGADWPVRHLDSLSAALDEAAASRSALAAVDTRQVELSALVYEMLKRCKRQRYVDALRLIPEIVERLHRE